MTLKNGVPINYIEGISLFEWMEVGFNTFYAFRDGETAWIYSKVLHFLHQLTGVTCFSVYPYQLGHENEEAIKSGAFWFYRKLGFRPGRPELLAITRKEEARMARDPGHRTSARTLRQLAAGHVFYEFGEGPPGNGTPSQPEGSDWRCSGGWRKNSAAILKKCGGPPRKELSQDLQVDLGTWSPLEQSAFENFASVLSLAPEVAQWTTPQKQTLVDIIRAKVSADERKYLRLLQQHPCVERDCPEIRVRTPNKGPYKKKRSWNGLPRDPDTNWRRSADMLSIIRDFKCPVRNRDFSTGLTSRPPGKLSAITGHHEQRLVLKALVIRP